MIAAPASQVSLKLVTAPAAELFSATDAAVTEALHIDGTEDNTYLNLVLATAREQFELRTGLALITQTWEASWDSIPCSPRDGRRYRRLVLGRAPLIALSSASYVNSDGTTVAWTLSGNLVAAGVGVRQEFGRACLVPTADWPDLGEYPQAFKIQYTAGYGTAAASVPEGIRLAVLMLAAHWYQNRLPVAIGNIVTLLPDHMESVLAAWRVPFLA